MRSSTIAFFKVWINYYSLFALTITIASSLSAATSTQGVSHPYPNHTLYTQGTIKPTHRSQTQLDNDVIHYYEQWKKDFLVDASTKKKKAYRVAFGLSESKRASVTVSEGQGYGMLITVLMAGYDPDAREIFDGLYGFVKAHRSQEQTGLMAWKVDTQHQKSNFSAFDGDADIAYALLLADKQWGSANGVNYHLAAEIMIDDIYSNVIGPCSKLPMLGDWVHYDGKSCNQFTVRSSDLMLANFYAFSAVEKRWQTVAEASIGAIKQLQDDYAAKTNLLPDFFLSDNKQGYRPASKEFLEGPYDGDYYYNACRTPMRIGAYTLLHKDSALNKRLQNLSLWLERSSNSKVGNIHAGYQLSGQPLKNSSYDTSIFISTFAIAAMHSKEQSLWLNRLYEHVYKLHIDYYEDSVTLLSLLILSGNYWD